MVKGGLDLDQNTPRRNYYHVTGVDDGCTITLPTTPIPNVLYATTPTGDSGGRTYMFNFYPYASMQPTIYKQSGTPLADEFQIDITDYTTTTVWSWSAL